MCHEVAGVCMHVWAMALAAVSVAVSCVASFALIYRHLRYNKHPVLRTLTIRILLMVPIYAVQAFCGLVLHVKYQLTSELLTTFREVYEAIVIFSVLQLLLVCIGGHRAVMHRLPDEATIATDEEQPEPLQPEMPEVETADSVRPSGTLSGASLGKVKHAWPMHRLTPWGSTRCMTKWCIRGTLPYVVVSVVCSIVNLIVWLCYLSEDSLENESAVMSVTSWALFVAGCLAVAALYDLVHGLMVRLQGLNPWSKLIAVKLVVFFTFWQGLIIQALLNYTGLFQGFVDEEHGWSNAQQISKGVNNFLLCIEMTIAAVAHFYAFPPKDFKRVLASRGVFLPDDASARSLHLKDISSIALSFGDAVRYRDIFRTAWDAGVPKKVKCKLHIASFRKGSEPTSNSNPPATRTLEKE
eukprot:TRINITY_DN5329_c1_g1_i1.p1 TRINITY_DN5329_c1_g1~~TRINITY_DN5329_c1_g1_i1.p1  ORF type:complete len:411 (-),score=63.40 TRINITY_DN5329_c1_g1_i1:58-1290(-)